VGERRAGASVGRVALASVPTESVPSEDVSPGILGFLLVFALGLTLYFLIRSMNKHIGRIQAPREQDLKQAEWERRQRRGPGRQPGGADGGAAGRADGGDTANAGERADGAERGTRREGDGGETRH
jgi:hypothetical protein